jgi:PAS domain S-box-containing protein
VNDSAIENYGYSEEEFRDMTILDVRPDVERTKLIETLKKPIPPRWETSQWIHKNKAGERINVSISSNWTVYKGKQARIVMAQNITEEVNLQKEKEDYTNRLREFAFFASHNPRGPVARLMGLNQLLNAEETPGSVDRGIVDKIQSSVQDIDDIIKKLHEILADSENHNLRRK